MEGFLMLGRSIFSHHLWQEDRVFSRAEAWLDFLQTAAIAPQKRLISGHPVEIPRGGIVASVRFLSVRYKWSNTKVCLFLDSLECEGMIRREKRHGNTVILLCNFDKYNTQKRRKGDGETTPGRRRGDEIEEGKETEKEKSKRRPASQHECEEFCRSIELLKTDGEWLWLRWTGNGFQNGGKPIRDWKATARTWKMNGYFPSQKNGTAPLSKFVKIRAINTLPALRERAAAYGAEFGAWAREKYGDLAEGKDDPKTCPRESMLVEFLQSKGERA